ncbi:MAG: YfhO family protein [bacterium]|nr:YfhO family protein [bacterium]
MVCLLRAEHRGGRILWLDNVNYWQFDQNQPEIYPNRLVMRDLPEARGYDPVNARWIGQWFNLLAGHDLDANPQGFMFVEQIERPAWLTLMGVETVVSYLDPGPVEGLRLVKELKFPPPPELPRSAGGTLKVWRNERFRGMAFAAPAPQSAANALEAQLRSAELAADPRRPADQAIVIDGLPPEEAAGLARSVDSRFKVAPLPAGPNSFSYAVEYPTPALLCLAQSAWGGWGATIDGELAPLYTMCGTFLAVVVPAGRHEVVFEFVPDGLTLGRMIGLLALVVLLYGSVRSWWMARKAAPRE